MSSDSRTAAHQGLSAVVERPVAGDHELDRYAVQVLDLVRRLRDRRGEGGIGAGRPGIQPRAQLALLGAGELRDRGGVVGPALDEGQGLEHGVVQVGGDVGALGGAGPLGLLVAQLAPQPKPPRSRDEDDAGEDRQRGQPDVPDGGERATPGREDDQPGEGEEAAEGEAGCAEPAGAGGPTRATGPAGRRRAGTTR